MRQRFADSTVVFIGASLTDEHLLRYIVRYARPEKPPIALLVEDPDDKDPVDEHSQPDPAEKRCTELELARWEHLQLTVLQASFRSQPAQFLHEVVHHKESSSARRYGERLDDWYRSVCQGPLGLISEKAFAASQKDLLKLTQGWLADLTIALEQNGYDLSDEALAQIVRQAPSLEQA